METLCPRGLRAVFNPVPKDRLIFNNTRGDHFAFEWRDSRESHLWVTPPCYSCITTLQLRTVLAKITSVEIVGWAINSDLPRA